jgi:lipopolysaccharide-assembly LptC-related protein
MLARDSVRRAVVFLGLFGAVLGVLIWRAGGLRARTNSGDEGPPPTEHAGPLAPIAPDLSMGASENGTITRDDTKLVDGRPVRWRAWTASWKSAVPRPAANPDESVQDIDAPRLVLYPEPRRGDARPVAEGGPGTTTVTSRTGTLKDRRGVRTEIRLAGDVAVDHVDPDRGDAHLRTNSLDVTLQEANGVTKRHVASADRVAVTGARGRIEGVGLDGEVAGSACAVTLLEDVKASFLMRGGVLSGGSAAAKDVPLVVTCAGAAELVALDDTPRPADRRWKATFHDKVHVVQADSVVDCDLLEVEFRMGELKSADALPPERVVATGHVRVQGTTETRVFTITADKATHSREGATGVETDVVLFEGNPVLDVQGAVGPAGRLGKDAAAAPQRLEIRSAATATMTTRRSGKNALWRTSVAFEKDVVARQWDDATKGGDPTAEMRAPIATLYGTRLENAAFQPEALTAQGPGGVELKRRDMTGHGNAATWFRKPEAGVDTYILQGNSSVTYRGPQALHPFGRAKTSEDGRIVIESGDNLTVDVWGDAAPRAPNAPPAQYAKFTADRGVVFRQLDGDAEIYRLAADTVTATVDASHELEQAVATGAPKRPAHIWGLAEDGQERDLYGTTIRLDRDVMPAGTPKGAPRTSQVLAVGDASGPAVVVLREKDGSRHEARAERLHYHDDGRAALVTASRNVVATLDMSVREAERKDLSQYVAGAVTVSANDAKIELAPATEAKATKRQLRRVVAEGRVSVDGRRNRLVGESLDYDAATGIAELRGHDARLVSLMESSRYTNSVNAPLLRAYLDVSEDPAKRGELIRAACPEGGMILRYIDPPDAAGGAAQGSVPRRLQLQSDGPIEVTREDATAVGDDVAARLQHLEGADSWTPDVTAWCNRAHMTYDLGATGGARDRVTTLEAEGRPDRPVRVDTPRFTGTATRVEIDAKKPVLHLASSPGHPVKVKDKTDQRTVYTDDGWWNYAKREWELVTRFRETE